MQKLLILLIISFAILMPSLAQEATEEAHIEPIQFDMFTLTSPAISGIYPADWNEVQVGAYVRDDGLNTTYVLNLAKTDSSLEELIAPILPSLGLDALPEASETYKSETFQWTVYKIEYTPTQLEGETLLVDLATAEDEKGVYLILLQSNQNDYEKLHKQVFLPILDAFGLPPETIAKDYNIIKLKNITIADFGIESAVPTDWQAMSSSSYMRAETQDDITTLLIQTSPDLEAKAFANLLLEKLGLKIELPESDTSYKTDYLSWSLYTITVTTQGVDVNLQIAIAQDEQFAYLVTLLSLSDESNTLHDSILLPVLDATHAIEG